MTGDIYAEDMSDEQIVAAVSAADDRETIAVTVSFTAAELRLMDLNRSDESFCDHIRRMVYVGDTVAERGLSVDVGPEVEIPPEVLSRARLRNEIRQAHGKDSDLDSYLFEYVNINPDWKSRESLRCD